MKYSEARQGRVFVIRLEDGEIIHEKIEQFAEEKAIQSAMLIALGGADKGSVLVTGPQQGRSKPIIPMELILNNVHEATGIGTLFPDKSGKPILHMHMSFGRKGSAKTGCIRRGVKVWHVLEVILIELLDCSARRLLEESGFELLNP
jgi:predicted DNA-binding protein with PD1-like motif